MERSSSASQLFRYLTLVLIALWPAAIFAQNPIKRIIGGHNAAVGTAPWMGSLHRTGYQPSEPVYGHFCAAFLVNSQYALTGAQCVKSFQATPANIAATFGRNKLSDAASGVTVGISAIYLHPNYSDTTLQYDVAVLKLSSAITAIPAVPIIPAGKYSSIGSTGIIYGWGVTTTEITVSYSDILQEASISIPSQSACQTSLGSFFYPSSMMCAGKLSTSPTTIDGIDACSGDGGGVLLSNVGDLGMRAVGVTSWGYACASSAYYGVYARLDVASNWIYSIVPLPPPKSPFQFRVNP
jgi:trypsin